MAWLQIEHCHSQPAKTEWQHISCFSDILALVYCGWTLNLCHSFSFQVCLFWTDNICKFCISDYQHAQMYSSNHGFLECMTFSWSKLTKMSNNSNKVHFNVHTMTVTFKTNIAVISRRVIRRVKE